MKCVCGNDAFAKEKCRSCYMREYNQKPEVKERKREYNQTPEVKERKSELALLRIRKEHEEHLPAWAKKILGWNKVD